MSGIKLSPGKSEISFAIIPMIQPHYKLGFVKKIMHPSSHLGGFLPIDWPGTIAWSVAMLLGNQEAPRSILASGTSFCEDLVMKLFLQPFFLFR